jgi:hypothetical protein
MYVYYSIRRITQKKGRLICLHDRQAGTANSKHAAGQAGRKIYNRIRTDRKQQEILK